jgi:hypothetical protein
MAIKYVVPVNKAAIYDGTNATEMCDVANLTGFGPFTVISESSGQLVIGSRGFNLTFQIGYAMLGTSVLTPAELGADWAEVVPIGQQGA